jgi:hypothetical protein
MLRAAVAKDVRWTVRARILAAAAFLFGLIDGAGASRASERWGVEDLTVSVPTPIVKQLGFCCAADGSKEDVLLNRPLQRRFLDLITVCVLNPSLVADSSQVLDQAQCVFRVVRMYLRAAARTFRLHNHPHRSDLTLRVANEVCRSKIIRL